MEEEFFENLNTVLIQLVHKNSNLYDKSSKDYKDNLKRKESWAEIVSQFKKNGCDVTGKEVNNRWNQLKARYIKERTILKKYIPSGSHRWPELKIWPYYYDMDFLDKKIGQRKTTSNFNLKEVASIDNEFFDEEFDVEYSEPDSEGSENLEDSLFSHFPIEEECEINENRDEAAKSPITAMDTSDDTSLLNEHLLVLREAWQKVPKKNRKNCYVAFRKLILAKKSAE